MRKPIIAGNWKMHLSIAESVALAEGVASGTREFDEVDVVVCPVATSLAAVADALKDSAVAAAAQNCYCENSGAYTGEIAPTMILDAGATWCVIGHSERRKVFGEADELLNRKLRFALDAGLRVMFCIGETLEEREGGNMESVLRTQVNAGLDGVPNTAFDHLVLAYEPVWAIGTGVTASPAQAEEAHVFVRGLVADQFDATLADSLRIQYGGSVKPDNAAELLGQANVDGALVGGASLTSESFSTIVDAAQHLAPA